MPKSSRTLAVCAVLLTWSTQFREKNTSDEP